MKGILLVKPEAMRSVSRIEKEIASSFDIEHHGLFRLSKSLITMLYPFDSDKYYFPSMVAHLISEDSALYIVQIPTFAYLLDFVGRETRPEDCNMGTLRYKYGVHHSSIGGYIKNGIHRTKNEEEFIKDMKIFFG